MRRGAALYIVGSATLLTLAGCGAWMGAQREPWRRDAEVACMRSGAVKTGAAAVAVNPINGPGVCGADHPLKVAALGDRTILGYLGEPRPTVGVGRGFPIPPPREVATRPSAANAPMPIHAPGTEPDEEDVPDDEAQSSGAASSYPARDPYALRPQAAPSPQPLPALGPRREVTGSVTPAAVAPTATLACPLVARLDQWIAASVQPAAMRWFGQQVVEIKQISAYSCRGMNGNPRAKISEHAFGNALDIAAFTFADGRRVTVKNGWRGAPEEQGFLRDVHAAACDHFSTVLAPGSNRYHYDHIHVDLARRRSDRNYCNPKPIPGDLVAQRARGIGGPLGFAPDEGGPRGLRAPLPEAIPGED